VYINCPECQKQFLYTTCFPPCSELGIFVYLTCNSMNNLSSYCGLVDAKISASDKDLPVSIVEFEPFKPKTTRSIIGKE
jgi:hypothetical protein